jgi:hypothetical protein
MTNQLGYRIAGDCMVSSIAVDERRFRTELTGGQKQSDEALLPVRVERIANGNHG